MDIMLGYCSGSWHIAVNSNFKRFVHGVDMHSMGMHDVGLALCGHTLHSVAMRGGRGMHSI
jgi:hypothetical protein